MNHTANDRQNKYAEHMLNIPAGTLRTVLVIWIAVHLIKLLVKLQCNRVQL